MPDPAFVSLRDRLAEQVDMHAALAILDWDQAVFMPTGGGDARSRQLATIVRIAHERHVAAEFERALIAAERAADALDPSIPTPS